MKKLNVLPPHQESESRGRFPSWLHRQLPRGAGLSITAKAVQENRLFTVCEEAKCPNRLECWSQGTATFLVMGKQCTRNCGFCDIDFSSSPKPLEADEPLRVAESVKALKLQHVVITMVARDDQPDGGAEHLVKVMQEVRKMNPQVTIEVLTSDFQGNEEALNRVIDEKPEIFNHNIETVRSLSSRVRHKATYERTLQVLETARKRKGTTLIKSGLMVGWEEREEEVQETLRDLQGVGCEIVTMGQYLQPSQHKLRVKEFVTPAQFEQYAEYGRSIGIPFMYCGPFVRSSYNASQVFKLVKEKNGR